MQRVATRTVIPATIAALTLAACGNNPPQLHGGRHHSKTFLEGVHVKLAAPQRITAAPAVPGLDAVTVGNLPLGLRAAGCYVSGPYANCPAVRAREPHAQLVTIATWAGVTAKILDTEPGDATPSQDGPWVRRMIAARIYRPGIYASAAWMPSVRASLNAAGLQRSQYVLWVADWNYNPAIPYGYDAIQWKSTSTLDFDTFASSFFAAPPAPKPPKPRLRCWGPHAKTANATCRRVRPLLSRYSHARNAARRALAADEHRLAVHRCRRPYRRGICIHTGHAAAVQAARVGYFDRKAKALFRSYS